MGKHRLRSRIKSMVENLFDPEKDDELNGETEENYNQILELLKEEDQDKIKLVELIDEYHNRYRSIYERYDNITNKLKEKVKKENDSSSSSSSDSDSDNSSNKNGKLKNKISLNEELRLANNEIEELKNKLTLETEEKEALNLHLRETEKMLNESKLKSDQLVEENSKLLAVETELKQNIEESRAGFIQMKGEKEGIESELQDIKLEFSNLFQKLEIRELENKTLSVDFSQQQENLAEVENELLKKTEMHETFKNEVEVKMMVMEEELASLRFEKTEIEKQKEGEIVALEKKIEKMSDQIENGLRSNEEIVDQLEETIEDLKSDVEIKKDEVNTLTEYIRNLEVKIRLSKQKLHITEQMLNETEHDHTTKEEKLHQENKSLLENISILSQTIVSTKREVQEKVNEVLTGVDSLTVKFEEDYGHVTTRVDEITNEIQAACIHLKRIKEDSKQKVEDLTMKLEAFEGENKVLTKSLEDVKMGNAEKDEKIKELENTIHVKDEWITGFCEEKREAIKQLCVWADYQRDCCDHLHELLLKTAGAARRQTVR